MAETISRVGGVQLCSSLAACPLHMTSRGDWSSFLESADFYRNWISEMMCQDLVAYNYSLSDYALRERSLSMKTAFWFLRS